MICPSYLGWLWVGAGVGFALGFLFAACVRVGGDRP